MQFIIKWLSFSSVEALSFLLLPNNLILFSFFGFLFSQKCLDLVWNDTRLHPTLPSPLDLDSYIWQFILSVNVIISWFVLSPASVGEIADTRQRISSDWKTLENQPTNLHTHSAWPWMNSLKAFFFLQEEGFQVWTALSLFTINALRFFANFLLLTCLCPTVTHTYELDQSWGT